MLIATTALITISYKKGEKPRWQWGEKNDEGSGDESINKNTDISSETSNKSN